MKINGTFKFKTSAIFYPLTSLYVKYEFYNEQTKISQNEFASIASLGVVNDFGGFLSFNSFYPPTESSCWGYNLSPNVVATVIAATNNKIVYERVFDNLINYSIIQPAKRSILESNNLYPSIDSRDAERNLCKDGLYRLILPQLKVYIEPSPSIDNKFNIYGIISTNDRGYSRRDFGSHYFSRCYFPDYFFKDYEPLIQLGETTTLPYDLNSDGRITYIMSSGYRGHGTGSATASAMGETLFSGYKYYAGAGMFLGHPGAAYYDNAVIEEYNASFSHIYPETKISAPLTNTPPGPTIPGKKTLILPGVELPVNFIYWIDPGGVGQRIIDVDYIISIRDINGDLYYVKKQVIPSVGNPRSYDFPMTIWKNNEQIPFSKTGGWSFGRPSIFDRGFFERRCTFFCLNGDIFTSDIKYNQETKKMDVELQKNVPESILNISNVETIFDVLMSGRTPQKAEYKLNMLNEFTQALIETYPGNNYSNNLLLPIPNKNNELFYGLRCYSSETKTRWEYCGSIFNPDRIEWSDIN